MSRDFLEVTYDKFTFRVQKDRLYHADECWAKEAAGLITIGVTDFLQRNAGDVAFLELPEVGTEVFKDSQAGIIETIKTTVTLISPVSGVVKEVNSRLEDEPQLINEDPYGIGWLIKIAPKNWAVDAKTLMDPEAYFPIMEVKIKRELEKA